MAIKSPSLIADVISLATSKKKTEINGKKVTRVNAKSTQTKVK